VKELQAQGGQLARMKEEEEKVGYCRPPRQHRFRKGSSGNPRGRPRKPRSQLLLNDADIFRRLDAEEIEIGGKVMTRREAELRRLFQLAIKGDRKARRLAERIWGNRTSKSRAGGVLALPFDHFMERIK